LLHVEGSPIEIVRHGSAAGLVEIGAWLPGFVALGLLAGLGCRRRDASSVVRGSIAGSVALLGVTACVSLIARGTAPGPLPSSGLEPSAVRHPPTFLVLVDTLRADHVSALGYRHRTTPNLDALAADGTLHERTFAPASWTRPSCAALLTSRLPHELGVVGLSNALPEDVPTLAQFMKLEGYATVAIVASAQLGPQFGFAKGFDTMDIGSSHLRWAGVTTPFKRLRLSRRSDNYPRYNAEELTDRAITWLDHRPAPAGPPFMYLHYADPHHPYEPPVDQDRWRDFASPRARQLAEPPSAGPPAGTTLSPAERDALVARYDAEVAFVDRHLGRLLEYLRTRDLYAESLIIVTADHGEEFSDHGGWGHGQSLYNELLHVPLVIKYPKSAGVGRGRTDGALASLVDVTPTIRDVLGADWGPASLRGRSLQRPERAPSALFARNHRPPLRALYQGEDKLIQVLDADGRTITERYYSLRSDFTERGDGAPSGALSPQRLEEMRGHLAAFDAEPGEGREVPVDDQTAEELRALGYIQ
jgi:arylsulfatase A-like enzyme